MSKEKHFELNEVLYKYSNQQEEGDSSSTTGSVISQSTRLSQDSQIIIKEGGNDDYGLLEQKYKLYSYRWVIVTIFCILVAAMGMQMLSFSAAAVQISKILDVSMLQINMCMGVYMIVTVFFAVPANYLNDKYGIHVGVYIGTILFIIGAWVRVWIRDAFWLTLIGQSLGGIAFCFANAPAKVAAVWLGAEQTGLGTTIMTAAVPLGTIIGFALPNFYIPSQVLKKFQNLEKGQSANDIVLNPDQKVIGSDGIVNLIYLQNIIFTIVCILLFIFMRKKPPTPPSASSQPVSDGDFKSTVKQLCKNRDFILMLISFNLIWGVYGTMGACVSSITIQFGFGPAANSIFGICFVVFGIVGSFFVGKTLDKTKKFKRTYIIWGLVLVFSVIVCYLGLLSKNIIVGSIAISTLGLAVLPFLPMSFEFGAELTFPLGQAIMGGMLVGTSQFSAAVILTFIQMILEKSVATGFFVLFVLVLISFFISLTIRQNLNRTNAGKKKIVDEEDLAKLTIS